MHKIGSRQDPLLANAAVHSPGCSRTQNLFMYVPSVNKFDTTEKDGQQILSTFPFFKCAQNSLNTDHWIDNLSLWNDTKWAACTRTGYHNIHFSLRWKSVALNYELPCTLMHGTGGIKYHTKYFRFHSFNVKRAILVSWTVLEGFQMFEQVYSSYNMYINCKFTFLYPEA